MKCMHLLTLPRSLNKSMECNLRDRYWSRVKFVWKQSQVCLETIYIRKTTLEKIEIMTFDI